MINNEAMISSMINNANERLSENLEAIRRGIPTYSMINNSKIDNSGVTMTEPTVLDIARTIERLDAVGDVDDQDRLIINDQEWTGFELVQSVADSISFELGRFINLHKITKRDAAVVLASHGGSSFLVNCYAARVARRIRANAAKHQRMGAWL